MSKRLLDGIVEFYEDEEILKADGFDEAVIGIEESSMRLIYSVGKCIEILITEEEMNLEDAVEHFDYNVKMKYRLYKIFQRNSGRF